MQRSGWNPRRRNRNIGTAKQGHGQANRMVIPSHWRDSRVFWERVARFDVVARSVHGADLPFVVERTRTDTVYSCTVDDVARLLNFVPRCDVFGIEGVIFRQPKRKEELLSPVWGRLGYAVEVGPIRGPAILVEAVRLPLKLRWSRRQGPAQQEELDQLMQEADRVESTARHHILHFGWSAARAVQLYRTVLHEVGHWVDYLDRVEIPSRADNAPNWSELWRAYRQRPVRERESSADRYARAMAHRLGSQRDIPFERALDLKQLTTEGLSATDFVWQQFDQPTA